MIRLSFAITTLATLSCTFAANAEDKTFHDQKNGFSLTFPSDWTIQSPSDEEIKLSVVSADLTCMVSASIYDRSAANSQSSTREYIEGWSMDNWKKTFGPSFNTADFSNDRLSTFPDGYPVRLADAKFTVLSQDTTIHGHSRFAFSVRGASYGYVNCSVMGQSAEQVAQMWTPLADKAERVVNSFILDPP
ncbi:MULTISPECIES: hypothetical protein [unclassified Mesorhizobium]|uniref:hypothetical protein n=1 Tax=unclassified Mesorhizobium TaxID=325217 RepID=UPI00112BE854|nr:MULTISPECIES: hypothetical protein [unclassified Mesorhizobium]MBZ9737564.1 hypothetical protein [Mesorhizobium sp. CO1-1-4]MBZ9802247.1 hypothetical protein [Mesorhizobium sp. ES1-6]MBZ9994899.1 hypothetical protein [Mesorhizobium sp. BH1-1-4]TPL93408.1 hypothetical protein FJ948_05850 [Mesorhizobium sp. B2-3-12]